jgi:hypothetical protein
LLGKLEALGLIPSTLPKKMPLHTYDSYYKKQKKQNQKISGGEDVEKSAPSYTADGNMQCCHTEECKKQNVVCTYKIT